MASKAWLEFERLRSIKERKHLPKVARALKNQFKFFADLYSTGGDIHTALPIEELSKVMENLYRDTGKLFAVQQARELMEGLKFTGGFWSLPEEWLQEISDYYRRHLLDKVVLPITATSKQICLEVILQATEEGWGVDKTAREIIRRGAELQKWRSKLIVRTETVRAANLGKWTAGKEFKFQTNKTWRTAQDNRVRPLGRWYRKPHVYANHVKLDGKTVDLNGRFENGLLYPGDPAGPAKEVCNCRCTITFRSVRDAQGNFIPVNSRPATYPQPNALSFTLTDAISSISAGIAVGNLISEIVSNE